MSDDGYAQTLYELRQLRDGDVTANASAQSEVEEASRRVERLRGTMERTRSQILDDADRLKTTVPDLRPDTDDAVASHRDLDAELAAATAQTQTADKHVVRAIREAQLAPLLPGAPALVRNLVVYGAAMVACYLIQAVLTLVAPADTWLWLAFIPPVLALVAAYLATGLAGTPRLDTHDERGRRIEFVVKKSPRLGATLAVATIVTYFLTLA